MGICALLGIVIYRWSGWETLLVMIPMAFVMLLLILPGTAFSFISHRSPALIISSRGLYWQGTLSGVPTTDYFLFWENITRAEQEGTTLRLKYYSGAVFNGEPMPEKSRFPAISLQIANPIWHWRICPATPKQYAQKSSRGYC